MALSPFWYPPSLGKTLLRKALREGQGRDTYHLTSGSHQTPETLTKRPPFTQFIPRPDLRPNALQWKIWVDSEARGMGSGGRQRAL